MAAERMRSVCPDSATLWAPGSVALGKQQLLETVTAGRTGPMVGRISGLPASGNVSHREMSQRRVVGAFESHWWMRQLGYTGGEYGVSGRGLQLDALVAAAAKRECVR